MASIHLQLNNLVEYYMPIDSDLMQITCQIPLKKSQSCQDTSVIIDLSLPYTLLVQKLEFELDEQFCKDDFAKVFLFDKMFRKNGDSEYKQIMKVDKPNLDYQSNFQATASLDQELEMLRNQVMSCDQTTTEDGSSSNRHTIKVLGVGSHLRIKLRVAENFGVDLTSAKEHPNKELQEDLRSLSRLQADKNQEETNFGSLDEHKTGFGNTQKIQSGQNNIKNDHSQIIEQEISTIKSTSGPIHNAETSRNQQKKKQEQPSLDKTVQENTLKSGIAETEAELTKSRVMEEQARVEKIFKRAFGQIVQGIRIYAYPIYRIPQANNLVQLMNTSFQLNGIGHLEEKKDIDFLVALGMMSGRKFIQACEQLRRLQVDLITSNQGQELDKAIQIEILIADSMNQHSQMLEKIFAFQRAVDLSLKRKIKAITFSSNIHQIYQIKEEEAYFKIMAIHPYLIKLLLQHIDSKIEAVKLASLRTIEFLVDRIGCSLDQYLVQILIAVITTYPRQNNYSSQSNAQVFREGFFQQNNQGKRNQSAITQSNYQIDLANTNSVDNILQNLASVNLQIKEVSNFQMTYTQSIKNSLNHILESFISLLSSLSSNILQSLFNEVIQKCVFIGMNPFENQLSTDLRIYLLKFTDKIINICQGDLILSQQFLNNIVSTMIPDSKALASTNKPQQLGDSSAKLKQKASETIILACNNLWQTIRQKLFVNYSNKGLKQLLEWVFGNLMSLADNFQTLSPEQLQQLTLVFDVIDLIATQQSQSHGGGATRQFLNKGDEEQNIVQQPSATQSHAHISNRDTRQQNMVGNDPSSSSGVGTEFGGPENVLLGNTGNQQEFCYNSVGFVSAPALIKIQTKSVYSLEIYTLINPILFWLDYSLEKQDRLPLFKVVWRALNKILGSLPSKKIEIDSVSIILPVLHKVNAFCKESSPSLEMLQFLQIVFQDFKAQNPQRSSNSSSKELKTFVEQYIKTLCHCIPHHLHEEIFQVCEQMLDLHKHLLSYEQIQEVVSALINKYTMRSKAHKRLTSYFLQLILDQSMVAIEKGQAQNSLGNQQQNNILQFQGAQQDLNSVQATPSATGRQQPPSNSAQYNQWQTNVPGVQAPAGFSTGNRVDGGGDEQRSLSHHQMEGHDEIDNYEYDERESYHYVDDDEEEMMLGVMDNIAADNNTSADMRHGNGIGSVAALTNTQNTQQTNQDYQESPISQRVIHRDNIRPLRGDEIVSSAMMSSNLGAGASAVPNHGLFFQNPQLTIITTYFSQFIEVVLFDNQYEPSSVDKHLDHINLELYFEKISLLMQLLKLMEQKHVPLFCKLLNNRKLKDTIMKMFQNEKSTVNAIELLEQLSSYYMANCSPKNVYEHPIQLLYQSNNMDRVDRGGQTQPLNIPPISNNHQNSQNSGQGSGLNHSHHLQHQQQNNREFSRSFMSNNNIQPLYSQQNRPNANQNSLRHSMPLNLHDSLLQGGPHQHIQEEPIQDEVDIINKERLLLIELYACIIRQSISLQSQTHHQQAQCNSAYLQFHTLNMLDNLFSNLMPVATFQNNVIRLAQKRRTTVQANQASNDNGEVRLHSNEIPDIEKLNIIDNPQAYKNLMQQQQQPGQQPMNIIQAEFECQDVKYLNARLHYAFKVWQFMENSLFQSSWSNIRSSCYGLFCQILKIDLQQYKQTFQSKLKQVLFPLLSNLLNSKESESKAGGLNILGAFCGIGHDFNSFQHLKISQNMSMFKKNSNFVSLAIWQQIFNLQEDWDSTIREAASVLIQFCAPRESIKHFHSIEMEKYQLKLSQLVNSFSLLGSHKSFKLQSLGGSKIIMNQKQGQNQFQLGRHDELEEEGQNDRLNYSDQPSPLLPDERNSQFNQMYQSNQSIRGIGSVRASHEDLQDLSDEEQNNSPNDDDNDDEVNSGESNDYFYVDQYNEEQIKEMIGIFKNDYKPHKSLWIEKNGAGGSEIKGNTDELFSNTVDVFDDNIVNKLNNKLLSEQLQNQPGTVKSDEEETEYLIFERHFESEKNKTTPVVIKNKQELLDVNQEELGIIDLDEADGQDEFDELDDDKLPVLKNTYSKKNRPNNSKSVAIGSRSQDSKIKPKNVPDEQLIEQSNKEKTQTIPLGQKQPELQLMSHKLQDYNSSELDDQIYNSQDEFIKQPRITENKQSYSLQIQGSHDEHGDTIFGDQDFQSQDQNELDGEESKEQIKVEPRTNKHQSAQKYQFHAESSYSPGEDIIEGDEEGHELGEDQEGILEENEDFLDEGQYETDLRQQQYDNYEGETKGQNSGLQGGDANCQDQMIDEYEQMISQTIQVLNQQLHTTSNISNQRAQLENQSLSQGNSIEQVRSEHQQEKSSSKGVQQQKAKKHYQKIIPKQLNTSQLSNQTAVSRGKRQGSAKAQLHRPSYKIPTSPSRLERSTDSASVALSSQSNKCKIQYQHPEKDIQLSDISINAYPVSAIVAKNTFHHPLQSKQSPQHITIAQPAGVSHVNQSNSQLVSNFPKKTNDPLYINKSSYTAQANKLKLTAASQMKKDQQSRIVQSAAFSHTSPGPLSSAMLHSQQKRTTTATSPNNKDSFTSYGKSNTRKRKSEYQRKSEVPAYNSKKFSSNPNSHNQSQSQQAHSQSTQQIHDQKELQQIHNDPNSKSIEKKAQVSSVYPKVKKQQAQMSQASMAFVSRAKSQSYLNSVMASGSSASMTRAGGRNKKIGRNQHTQAATMHGLGALTYGRQISLQASEETNKTNPILQHIRVKAFNQQSAQPTLHQNFIHKGYFSNDESQAMSPTQSADFNSINKEQFCSDDENNRHQPRSSSHTVKSRMKMMVLSDTEGPNITSKDQNDEEASSQTDHVLQRNDAQKQQYYKQTNDVSINEASDYMEGKMKLERLKQIYGSDEKQPQQLQQEQQLLGDYNPFPNTSQPQQHLQSKQNNVVFDMRNYSQGDEEDELEIGEYDSAQISIGDGGDNEEDMRQLSSIDEEEDTGGAFAGSMKQNKLASQNY